MDRTSSYIPALITPNPYNYSGLAIIGWSTFEIRHSQPVFQPKLLRGKDGERELAAKAYNALKLQE